MPMNRRLSRKAATAVPPAPMQGSRIKSACRASKYCPGPRPATALSRPFAPLGQVAVNGIKRTHVHTGMTAVIVNAVLDEFRRRRFGSRTVPTRLAVSVEITQVFDRAYRVSQ